VARIQRITVKGYRPLSAEESAALQRVLGRGISRKHLTPELMAKIETNLRNAVDAAARVPEGDLDPDDESVAEGIADRDAADAELRKQMRLILLDARTARSKARHAAGPIDPNAWTSSNERLRTRVLNRELGRLALQLGGDRGDDGQWLQKPVVIRFRDDFLGGRTLTAKQAEEFARAMPLAYLRASQLVGGKQPLPLVGLQWKRVPRADEVRSGRACRVMEFQLTVDGQQITLERAIPFSARHTALRVPTKGPDLEVQVADDSVLAELQRVSARVAQHYLWEESHVVRFVLTGALPYPPYFKAAIDGGSSKDHEHYRLTLSVPLWADGETVARMIKALRAQLTGRKQMGLSEARLKLVDAAAPRFHAGATKEDVAKALKKAGLADRGQDTSDIVRAVSETYELLMHERLRTKMPRNAASQASRKPRTRSERNATKKP